MRYTKSFILFGMLILVLEVCGAQIGEPLAQPKANLQISPESVVISPDLIKNPLTFVGSGWNPKEMVMVELLIPKGVKVTGASEDEDRVGIVVANADDKGEFTTKMGAMATMSWLLQVGWSPDPKTKMLKPDFERANPLPPGKYQILASGMESGEVSSAYLEVLSPPKGK